MNRDWDKMEFKAEKFTLVRKGNKFTFSYTVGMWNKTIATFSFKPSDDIKLFCEIIRLFTKDESISYTTMLKNAPGYKRVWCVGVNTSLDNNC